MENKILSLHESIGINDMLNFKTICMTQSKMLQGLVFDQDLKHLMEEDVTQSIAAISQLQDLLKNNKSKSTLQ